MKISTPKGKWCRIWDVLYRTFVDKHRGFFIENPRLSIIVRQLENMDKKTLKQHIVSARKYLDHEQ